ncbi:pyridoxal 5'-phosphate synthase glutaminase subunit PdxT [Saccharolobus islandicus]|jgi:5'-phosphate synthase pdxT subunit|uniref:Pyridoxal 5'-phosphate synthase subunit PdxT n=6 Tax=Saccharolobus islandicus TaxID=43080 RepID=PDXT_SACI3|nr:pyridoxal 5'-phosphate synthase glutaminase subunit PdxT [Sulfolobus islandicus]C3MW85.1 RecName: Full=Pyridoxal 5'-phosphate synthase subunit PdxT; AltName: Full=Pdx2; AltName: Full=Pyridoxal 5'-phosphate synthase glutaminase subunit [Sulfolobus islandicus M.14.25]C3N6C7.1 RecName: Full=Pyridoxal 5'-phosphate synthase subunit PdxT; AltName: Full=Pdx2; AltName: Full=Pyridoxal 5'-phosphate synthase glutaminase subunit [Sulfolobus islandicus M.16.27]C4KHU2.1 RecName: Full=Pyridoxal 5'-phosphate
MKIGIIAYQGSFEEHYLQLKRAFDKLSINGEITPVKIPKDLKDIDGVIIPGGESTTIGLVAKRLGILDELKEKITSGLPVMGTCAGAIMLAKEVSDAKVGKTSQPLIGAMNISIIRNYYGRQRESFEAIIDLSKIGKGKANVVFIRAPAITKLWGKAQSLAELNGVTVLAEENNILATTFHPELSDTTSIHEYFLHLVKG